MNTSPKSRSRTECVYCGSQQQMTRDHIPPKNLFPKPHPSNLVTVSCCRSCNESASRDDEFFRFIITRDDAGEHPEARKILPSVFKSLQRPQAMGLTNLMRKNLFDIDVYTPGGIYIERRLGYNADFRRFDSVASRIVKGLFWHEFGVRLPNTHKAKSWSDLGLARIKQELQDQIAEMGCRIIAEGKRNTVGKRVFDYWVYSFPEDRYTTVWVLMFYESVCFFCVTSPNGGLKNDRKIKP